MVGTEVVNVVVDVVVFENVVVVVVVVAVNVVVVDVPIPPAPHTVLKSMLMHCVIVFCGNWLFGVFIVATIVF